MPKFVDLQWIYILQMFLYTKENLTPSEIDSMDFQDWDLYLEISKNYSKGVEFKQKLEQQKAKAKSKK